jgi:CheY-like chemotaxis protein
LIGNPEKGEAFMDQEHPILVVEDSPEDWLIMQRALGNSNLKNKIIRMEDGDEALDYLYQRGAFAAPAAAPRPSLILLDLNLPGTDGRDVLKEIKADPHLRSLPVVVLTTSKDERDIESCYANGASSYITKPVDMEGFLLAFARLKDYWFQVVVLPKGENR